jgi:hypothetical protein
VAVGKSGTSCPWAARLCKSECKRLPALLEELSIVGGMFRPPDIVGVTMAVMVVLKVSQCRLMFDLAVRLVACHG